MRHFGSTRYSPQAKVETYKLVVRSKANVDADEKCIERLNVNLESTHGVAPFDLSSRRTSSHAFRNLNSWGDRSQLLMRQSSLLRRARYFEGSS